MSLLSFSPEITWTILGLVLVFIEFFIPGLVIIFFGVGALITALITWMFSPSLTIQFLVFTVSSILFLIGLRKYLKTTFVGKMKGENGEQNFNVEIGKIIPVTEYIQPGEVGGRVRYQGTTWSAKADVPIPPGESVRIIGCENITLVVEKMEKK
jgi:inner membrane protein